MHQRRDRPEPGGGGWAPASLGQDHAAAERWARLSFRRPALGPPGSGRSQALFLRLRRPGRLGLHRPVPPRHSGGCASAMSASSHRRPGASTMTDAPERLAPEMAAEGGHGAGGGGEGGARAHSPVSASSPAAALGAPWAGTPNRAAAAVRSATSPSRHWCRVTAWPLPPPAVPRPRRSRPVR